MPWTPPEDEQLNNTWTPPADEAVKPGFMDVFPKMFKEASTIGAPNVAQSMAGDIAGVDDTQHDPIGKPLETDTKGLLDVSIPDAMMAQGALSGIGEATGVTDTLGQYAKRFGQNQAIKAMGATGGQIGQAGIPESRAIGQMMIDKGAISPLRGPIGMEDFVNKLHNTAGANIGATRNLGDVRGEAPQMAEILGEVNKNLTSKYASGTDRAPATLNRAKEEIAKGGTGTFAGNAQKATNLNSAATANKLYRPQGATSDTADIISQMNNAKLKSVLSPQEWAQHQKDLSEYGPLSTAQEFMKRGERKEMAGRGGAGLLKTAADRTMDMMGNRIAATAGSGLGNMMMAPNPSIEKALAAYLAEKEAQQ